MVRAKSPNLVPELFYWTRQVWLQTMSLELGLWVWRWCQEWEWAKWERAEVNYLSKWPLDKAGLEAKGLEPMAVAMAADEGGGNSGNRGKERLGGQKLLSN